MATAVKPRRVSKLSAVQLEELCLRAYAMLSVYADADHHPAYGERIDELLNDLNVASIGRPFSAEERKRRAQKRADDFNQHYPVGTPVRYWAGVREGAGTISKTRTPAWLVSDHVSVSVEGKAGGIAISHVDVLLPGDPAARQAANAALNCGDCLADRAQIVPLVDGVCPQCGADYRGECDGSRQSD